MKKDSQSFYSQIPGFRDFREFFHFENYVSLPADWLVVITDIQDSTKAIEQGKYKEINSVGVASIVGVLNAIRPLEVPYVFGGDGATICLPALLRKKAEAALLGAKLMAELSFGLKLRAGIVSMEKIKKDGYAIYVSKYQAAPKFNQAMLRGDGLAYAEKLIKSPALQKPFLVLQGEVKPDVDFRGFECRWNEVPSPHEETVALLVQLIGERKANGYQEVLDAIFSIYGPEEEHHPLREQHLTLATKTKKLSVEARIRTNKQSFWKRLLYLLKLKVLAFGGSWYLKNKIKTETADWGLYKKTLIANTDYRKFDDVLRMVISGTHKQRQQLRDVLTKFRDERKIVFGLHHDASSLITCIISDYNTNHMHFLDGANGGYSLASVELKRQLHDFFGSKTGG